MNSNVNVTGGVPFNGHPMYFDIYDVNFTELCKAVDKCKGNVELITEDGDKFNLKSKLSQYVGIFSLIQGGIITRAKLHCTDEDDMAMITRLTIFGEPKELEENA